MNREIARLITMAWVLQGEDGTSTATTADATATTTTDTKVVELDGTILSDASKAAATDTKATGTDSKADTGDKTGADSKDTKAAAADAPIVYTDFKLPDGVEVDTETLDAAKTVFAELKLPQEGGQKLVDFYQERMAKAMEQPAKAWRDLNERWQADFKADKEIGGDRLTETVAAATKAMKKFGSPGLRDALFITGAGNHPEVIRFFAAVGKASGEDAHIPSDNATTTVMRTEDVMYPSMKKE